MTPIIEVKNLSKKYNITHANGRYIALRDVFANVFKHPFSFIKRKAKETVGLSRKEEFWALKDVNFEVNQGEIIGIIGRNGAGKSTLLKILSQITPPTTGEVKLRGRVGSLLEVGTGFHPELTGRENIFLNGAILGMKKAEIAKKFDEIVEFAGVEKFLDTPVKHYSSGMYVRLAFSVAAHMEPDILIIDEVLAVGDAEFQKKCLGKMEDVTKKEGRTVLFVSHNLGAIQQLCKKTVLIEKGKVIIFDDTKKVIDLYLNKDLTTKGSLERKNDESKKAQFSSIAVKNSKGEITSSLLSNENWTVELQYTVRSNCPKSIVTIEIFSSDGTLVYSTADADNKKQIPDKKPGLYKTLVSICKCLLTPGTYYLRYTIQSPRVKLYDVFEDFVIKIISTNTSARDEYSKGMHMGYIGLIAEWETCIANKKLIT